MTRIVVLGGGFAGMETLRALERKVGDRGGRQKFRFRRDRVQGIDFAARRVLCAEGEVAYDRLVIALGGVTATFGVPGVAEHALNYKTLGDALELRDHVLDLVEHVKGHPVLVKLVGLRKQIQVAVDWSLTRVFPRDSAIMRPAGRCPVCRRATGRAERDAA